MNISSYHFHLYYEINEMELAQSVIDELKELDNIEIGRLWDKPVGPHPIGSCQVTVLKGDFEKMSLWFLDNRKNLDVFVHAVSGDDIKDHTDYVMWIGKEHKLNLDFFGS